MQTPVSLTRMLLFVLFCSLSPALQGAELLAVIDDNGQRITLDRPAQRIISLAPSMTELLFSLGAGSQLVGVMAFSDFPDAARELPVIGHHDRLDMEGILALQPDLIIAWRSGNPRSSIARLRELGFPVYVAEPESLDSIADHLERLGELSGHGRQGKELAEDFRHRLTQLASKYSKREPVSVFYQVWHEPMISVGGPELINDIIMLCGGNNIFAELPVGPKVSEEAVINRRPEVIIASGSDAARPDWLDHWQRWTQLPATANGHLYSIHPDLVQRHSLRVLQGARQACNFIHQAR